MLLHTLNEKELHFQLASIALLNRPPIDNRRQLFVFFLFHLSLRNDFSSEMALDYLTNLLELSMKDDQESV